MILADVVFLCIGPSGTKAFQEGFLNMSEDPTAVFFQDFRLIPAETKS